MQILRYFRFLEDKEKAYHLLIILIILFALFTALVYFLPTTFIDIEFSEEVQEQSSPALNFIMKSISWFGSSTAALGITLGTALLFFICKFRKEALFSASTLIVSLLTFGIKVLINRPRPTADLVNIIEKAQHQSFPSGHTSYYVAFYGFITFLMLRLTNIKRIIRIPVIILSLFLIFTVPFSRIYLGAHWFTDVAGGFILGLVVLYGIIRFYIREKHSRNNKY